jgi:uncharacterized Tic20 family protein
LHPIRDDTSITTGLLILGIRGIDIFPVLGIIAFFAIAMAGLILTIIAGVKTAGGYMYRYAAIVRFVGPYRPRQA